METVITRDTDIIREYLAALDARARGMSPFARLAATVKLARLKRELDTGQIEATDEDSAALRREIDERTRRSFARRFESRSWGARISIFLMLVIGQQVALGLIMLAATLFVRLAPIPKRWNPVLPHEDPGYLLVFSFLFFFVTPFLALLVVFGGRFFGSWRKTLPALLLIIAVSAVGTYLVFHNTEGKNRVRHITSLEELARDREVNVTGYRQWVEANWLMSDPTFQRDYESYVRQGPGRWITTRIYGNGGINDSAWNEGIQALDEYLNGAQDPNGFREWLRYYLDRNRVYSAERIEQEVNTISGSASQRFLGLWQVEPFLKERDQRLYSAYLGEMGRKMRLWGLASLGVYSLVALAIFLTGPALLFWERMAAGGRGKRSPANYSAESNPQTSGRYYAFPERNEITTPPFFETPFRLLGRVHRTFMRLAASTLLVVFVFWGVVFAIQLSSTRPNPSTQVALMRSFLLIAPRSDGDLVLPDESGASGTYTTVHRARFDAPSATDPTASRVAGLEAQVDEGDYRTDRRFKEQYSVLSATQSEVSSLKNVAAQLQQTTTTGLPQQISQVGSQADAKAGQAIGDAAAARQMAQTVESQLSNKLKELETRTARASEEVGRIEAQASGIGTRTEKIEGDIINLAKQLEARTDELTNRTAKEREEQAARLAALQSIAFTGIVSELTASVDEVEGRIGANLYRFFNKGEAQREVESLRLRIAAVVQQLSGFTSEQAKQTLAQLAQLQSRVDQLSLRVK